MEGSVKKHITLLALFVLGVSTHSCDFQQGLSREIIPAEQKYFVECYLKPGALYNLTATDVQPIFEDYILDYSLDFEVVIIDTDSVILARSLFIDPETGFIYNYGSPRQLALDSEKVSLFVVAPNGDTLTADTEIPSQVVLESADYHDNIIAATFLPSENSKENFYIAIVNYIKESLDENNEPILVNDFDIQYIELGQANPSKEFGIYFENELFKISPDLQFTLMRVTEENFNYQLSLENAKNSSADNITYPSPLEGNLENGVGIFTAYTEAVVEF